jgi:aryl-alcohol dehydrogenase-like predicted oxidoreductase
MPPHAGSETLSRRALLVAGGACCGALAAPRGAKADAPELRRKIPSSGELLPAVGLGTAGTLNSDDPAARTVLTSVLKSLIAGGGTLIDTASTYGEAEAVIGAVITAERLREKLFVATKMEATEPAGARDELQRSLRRLQTARVDLAQLHNVRDPQQSLAMLRAFKAEGLCRYTGVTSTFPRDYAAMETVVRREKPDFMQIAYSIGDRQAEDRLLPAAMDAGSAVLTALPLGRSSLFRLVRGKALPDFAAELDIHSWGQFFLKYLLGNPAVTAVIPGTENAAHMTDNLGAGLGRLPDAAERRKMAALFDELK